VCVVLELTDRKRPLFQQCEIGHPALLMSGMEIISLPTLQKWHFLFNLKNSTFKEKH
jgi:hypothetical protein